MSAPKVELGTAGLFLRPAKCVFKSGTKMQKTKKNPKSAAFFFKLHIYKALKCNKMWRKMSSW